MLQECGLTKSKVDSMKIGKMPAADTLATIANYLEVPTDYLLGNEKGRDGSLHMNKDDFISVAKIDDDLVTLKGKLIGEFLHLKIPQNKINEITEFTAETINILRKEIKNQSIMVRIAARNGKKEIPLTPEQRNAIGKVVEESKKDDNSDLI